MSWRRQCTWLLYPSKGSWEIWSPPPTHTHHGGVGGKGQNLYNVNTQGVSPVCLRHSEETTQTDKSFNFGYAHKQKKAASASGQAPICQRYIGCHAVAWEKLSQMPSKWLRHFLPAVWQLSPKILAPPFSPWPTLPGLEYSGGKGRERKGRVE